MAGYIKDHRKELDSDIWAMPPLYHRVWQYLKYKVNYEDTVIPMRDGSKFPIKAGQYLTSLRSIAKDVGWRENRVWKEPNPKTINTILSWLQKQNMISIDNGRGNREYTLISLINWGIYQCDDVSSNAKVTARTQLVDIENKNKEFITTTTTREPDSKSNDPPEPENQDFEEEPFIQVLNAYCNLHQRFDIHVSGVERELMGKMIAGGVPSPFIIRTMTILHDEKRKREEAEGREFRKPSSFKYYDNGIWEAWRNQNAITAGVPTPWVAIGEAPDPGRDRKGSRYQSRREKTNDYLKQAWEEEQRGKGERPEAVFDHEQRLSEHRSG